MDCRPQVNGFWFANVGSIGSNCIYDYQICNLNNECKQKLIQGGREMFASSYFLFTHSIFFQGRWRNREPEDLRQDSSDGSVNATLRSSVQSSSSLRSALSHPPPRSFSSSSILSSSSAAHFSVRSSNATTNLNEEVMYVLHIPSFSGTAQRRFPRFP